MVKYSILVPVYNVEDYLPECVDSILDQDITGIEYEVILVDDGSTDHSGKICDSYSDRNDNIITIHQENRGLLQARASGVRYSRGMYLLFVDSDDYVDRDFLSSIDRCIEKYHPDFSVYGYIEERKGKAFRHPVTHERYEVYNRIDFLERFAQTDRLNTIWNKAVRAELLKDHIDEIYELRTNIGEDKLQTAYLIKYSDDIVFMPDCPYHYRLRDSSIAHYKSEDDIHKMISVYERVATVLAEIGKSDGVSDELPSDIMMSYNSVAINGIMEHIYKYNNRHDVAVQDKCCALKRIISQNRPFFDNSQGKPGKIRAYNRARLKLLMNEKFKLLIGIDRILKMVQIVVDN